MTIARRRGVRPGATAAIAQVLAEVPPAAPPIGVPVPLGDVPAPLGDVPAPDAVTPAGRLCRCTFRRVDRVAPLPQRPVRPTYQLMCLYVDQETPLPLGDVDEARPVCDACTATGIFRPDED